jgi:transposase
MLYYGLDVHKKYTTYCVMDDEGKILREGRCFNEDLPHHSVFSLEGRKRAVMEAGGNWYYVYDLLEPVVDELLLAHPLRVRAIAAARVKTDIIDARTLAHLLRADLIPAAYVPPPAVRELRELLRYRLDLVKQRTALKNRVHALLAKEGLASPFSDLFGRQGRQWLASLPLGPAKRQRLDGFLRVLDCLTMEIQEAELTIRQKAAADPAAQLLVSIPGIGALSALTILAEIGDIRRFPDAVHLVSYAGLAPRVRSSGGKTRLGHITKQGPSALRWVLIEATHIAVRKPGRLQDTHRRLRRGKNAAVATTACARQLLIAIYHMLRRGDAFRTDGSSRNPLTLEVA